MKNDLPISIATSHIILKSFKNINSVLVKLEAHFNFQALAGGWYENEDDILEIAFVLLTPHEFEKQKQIDDMGLKNNIADDVCSYYDEVSNRVTCFISITEAEEVLLIQQPKILSNYIKTKLLKVLNYLAEKNNKLAL